MSAGVRVTLIWTGGDGGTRTYTSSFAIKSDAIGTDPSQGFVDDAADIGKDWWDSGLDGGVALKSSFQSLLTLVGVHAETIGGSGTPLESDLATSIAGTWSGTSDAGAPVDSLLVSWQTSDSHTGPSGRTVRTTGRMYLPPPPFYEISASGLVDPTYGAAVELKATNLMDAVNDISDARMAVYRPDANVFSPVVNARVAKELATQRKRKPKRQGYFG